MIHGRITYSEGGVGTEVSVPSSPLIQVLPRQRDRARAPRLMSSKLAIYNSGKTISIIGIRVEIILWHDVPWSAPSSKAIKEAIVSFSAVGSAPFSIRLGVIHRCLLRSCRIQYASAPGLADLD